MTPPRLGVAILHHDLEVLRDWIFGPQRAIEIQDFIAPDLIAGDPAPLVEAYRAALKGHAGPRGIHGPFFGLDLSNPDAEIRGVIQRRLLKGLEIAEALETTQMVLHSPFTYWNLLNRANYAFLQDAMFEAITECLAPVLRRAAEVGCTLVLENLDDTDPAVRVQLAEWIGDANLGVSLDTGHALLAHGRYNAPPVVDFIAAAGGRLSHVHLQDADGYADRHWHPGDGAICWTPVFDALAELPEMPRLILEVRGHKERLPASVARLEARGLAC
ncbi:MAG: sugar phosphate isomerase/epimerase family protein [Paracoccaceae bacterium]